MSSLLSLVSGAARAGGRTVGRTVPLHLLPLLPLAISLNRQGWGGPRSVASQEGEGRITSTHTTCPRRRLSAQKRSAKPAISSRLCSCTS